MKTKTTEMPSLPARGSAKWVVRDLTRAEPSVSCDTKEQAETWVRHLWEWRPNARPVIEQEISPNDQAQRPGLTAGVERNETKGKSNE